MVEIIILSLLHRFWVANQWTETIPNAGKTLQEIVPNPNVTLDLTRCHILDPTKNTSDFYMVL